MQRLLSSLAGPSVTVVLHICTAVLLLVPGPLAGCTGGPAIASDSGAARDPASRSDRPAAPDTASPPACKTLKGTGQAMLGFSEGHKTPPRIAFDGQRFAVVWHTQPPEVSSLHGELRFARVDQSGRSETPDGISLGGDDGSLAPALTATAGEYAVLHRPTSASGGSGIELRRFDAQGQTLGTTSIPGEIRLAAMALHPSGYALLLAPRGSPQVVVVDRAGQVSAPKQLITAQIMASLWLALRPGGLAAALYTTNSNGMLHMLGLDGESTGMASVGHGLLIRSPSFAVTAKGFAAAYGAAGGSSSRQLEVELFDSTGQATGHHQVATTTVDIEATDQIAVLQRGEQLFVGYPGPVAGRHLLQILDGSGAPTGDPIPLPDCLATASAIQAVWGQDTLAVATLGNGSGVPNTGACVTLLACR